MAPRLKPLSDDKDLAAVPLDEPVLVELEPTATSLADDDAPNDPDPKPERRPEPEPDAGTKTLKEQLRAAEAATAEANRRAEQAQRDAAEARAERVDTEGEMIQTSLAGAQAERDAAKKAVQTAFDAGDSAALADAQERLGRAAADIRDFERAAAGHAATKEREEKAAKEPAKPVQHASVEASIDAQPGLTDAERTWLKAHQDCWVDPARNQELTVGYHRAVKAGLTRGTADYFAFIEDFMGYSEPGERAEPEARTERTPPVTAPVSRDNRGSMSGKLVNPQRIQLSPEERQIARDMGVSDVAYARGKQQLNVAKQADPERFRSRA